MRVGAILGFDGSAPPELVAAAGRIAEERGFASVFVPEHVLLFRQYASRYPYGKGGRLPHESAAGFLEPFQALTWLAAHTQRIRLATGICILPQRNPVYTAKQVASLDHLSGGRAVLGVGIGWLREEFDALGVPWADRASRTEEYVGILKTLWCDEVSRFEGRFHRLPECVQQPKPLQRPHPPILFGGESDAALRRAVRLGDGWFGFLLSPEGVRERLVRFEEILAGAGAKRSERSVVVFPADQDPRGPEMALRYADLGVDELVLTVGGAEEGDLERRADALAKLVT